MWSSLRHICSQIASSYPKISCDLILAEKFEDCVINPKEEWRKLWEPQHSVNVRYFRPLFPFVVAFCQFVLAEDEIESNQALPFFPAGSFELLFNHFGLIAATPKIPISFLIAFTSSRECNWRTMREKVGGFICSVNDSIIFYFIMSDAHQGGANLSVVLSIPSLWNKFLTVGPIITNDLNL